MKYLLPLLFLVVVSCNQVDTKMQAELADLKTKLAAAEKTLAQPAVDETTFIHTVFFWMKEGVTAEQKADFEKNGLGVLSKVPTIHKGYYGPPAMTPREVVDNTYDFALICHFNGKAAQDKYQVDPIHLKFIEDYKDLWERVQVYDNLLSE